MVEEKLRHLEAKIERRISTTRRSKGAFSYLYRYLSLALASLAALNTFLVAMSQYGDAPDPAFGILALGVSAILTVISAVAGSLNPKDKFIKNADALNEVMDLRERLAWRKLKSEDPITDQELDQQFEAFRALEKGFFNSLAKASIQDSE